jgi:Tfp pilus assembly protein PilN
MIRINLLPEEFRKAERTSPKLFAAVLLTVMAVCGSVGWFGYVYFGELEQLDREHTRLSEQLAAKKDSVGRFDMLTAERTDYQQRAKTIHEIAKSRVLWTRILDELIDIVNNDGDAERHQAWFRSLMVKDGRDAKQGPSIVMPGFVQGDSLRAVADFHEDVWRADFFEHVHSKSMPTAKKNEDPSRKPAESLFFQLELTFDPPQKWDAAPTK